MVEMSKIELACLECLNIALVSFQPSYLDHLRNEGRFEIMELVLKSAIRFRVSWQFWRCGCSRPGIVPMGWIIASDSDFNEFLLVLMPRH